MPSPTHSTSHGRLHAATITWMGSYAARGSPSSDKRLYPPSILYLTTLSVFMVATRP